MNYRKHFQTKQTPQSQPIPGRAMVKNSAGGYAFQVDDWKRLTRFLVLGSSGGTFYATEHDLTVENAKIAQQLLTVDGQRVVNQVVEISQSGRAPKNDQALFVLAMAAGMGDNATRKLALKSLPLVARTGTHLFQFMEYVEGFRGWGRGLREAIAAWYTSKNAEALVYQLVKYQQRNGWSHRDALRLAHPKHPEFNSIFKWVVKGEYEEGLPKMLDDFDLMRRAENERQVVEIVKSSQLPWEAIPTQWLASKEVWKALLPGLPLMAMVRNLGRLTANGTLTPMSDELLTVVQKLGNQEVIKKSRLHPMSLLVALKTYEQGHGDKGKLTWSPLQPVIDALDKAFYLAFGNVEPTNKRILFAIDASGSMTANVNGASNLSCRQAAVALALVSANVEPVYHCVGFTSDNHLVDLPISPRQRLTDAIRLLERSVKPNGTDCALPVQYALQRNIKVDAFVILTDNETWAGHIHPVQVLEQYRRTLNPHAKMIVQAMSANGVSIADQKDMDSLDVVGFDTSAPQVISGFISGQV